MTQRELRLMKDSWWAGVASELEAAADKHDMRSFYHNLKKVFGGPKEAGSTPVLSKDKTVGHYESLGGTLQCSSQSVIILRCVGSFGDPTAAN